MICVVGSIFTVGCGKFPLDIYLHSPSSVRSNEHIISLAHPLCTYQAAIIGTETRWFQWGEYCPGFTEVH